MVRILVRQTSSDLEDVIRSSGRCTPTGVALSGKGLREEYVAAIQARRTGRADSAAEPARNALSPLAKAWSDAQPRPRPRPSLGSPRHTQSARGPRARGASTARLQASEAELHGPVTMGCVRPTTGHARGTSEVTIPSASPPPSTAARSSTAQMLTPRPIPVRVVQPVRLSRFLSEPAGDSPSEPTDSWFSESSRSYSSRSTMFASTPSPSLSLSPPRAASHLRYRLGEVAARRAYVVSPTASADTLSPVRPATTNGTGDRRYDSVRDPFRGICSPVRPLLAAIHTRFQIVLGFSWPALDLLLASIRDPVRLRDCVCGVANFCSERTSLDGCQLCTGTHAVDMARRAVAAPTAPRSPLVPNIAAVLWFGGVPIVPLCLLGRSGFIRGVLR